VVDDARKPRRPVGRPARIGRDQVVAAAVAVGIHDLTMAAVAERLGTSHQALYRWVRNRDELVALVADAYVQRVELPASAEGGWREWLRRLADVLYDAMLDLPGFAAEGLSAFRTSLPYLRLNEAATRVLVDAGFAPATAQRIYQAYGTALLGWLVREDAYRPLREHPEAVAAALDATFQEADEDMPLARATILGELTSSGPERYRFLVDSLLAGLPDPP
jgi:AcrR family transcriptional regulator